ncbi:hypothetical protein KQX54_000557 [Cotesia glomerata]|uniref:Uncharacterized protein n=1 Tax=Cotesia glomerata TaxID=32391 RepID=A0AAV7IDS5_COTGL|nr:hypothetical protein KQX54_000557 [Cotesia glomerata]
MFVGLINNTMGSALSYEMVVPEEWYLNYSKHQIFDEIRSKIRLLQQDDCMFSDAEFIVGDTKTKLLILDVERCWCFVRENDEMINPRNYYFSGNLIVQRFPELYNIYAINQQRRNLEILSFNLSNINVNDDDGFFDENQVQRIVNSEDVLQYDAIYPKVWGNQFSPVKIAEEVERRIFSIMEHEDGIENMTMTIAGQPTILTVISEKFCWWFKLWNHDYPNMQDYIFTGNLLQNHFSDLLWMEKMED